jgi:hypothetical protein
MRSVCGLTETPGCTVEFKVEEENMTADLVLRAEAGWLSNSHFSSRARSVRVWSPAVRRFWAEDRLKAGLQTYQTENC